MKISVLGAGAVGSVMGGLLSLCGHDVHLIGSATEKPANTRRVSARARPMRIILADAWHLADRLEYGAVPDPDLLLVTLGRQHLHALKRDSFRNQVDREKSHVVFANCDPAEPGRLGFTDEKSSLLLTIMEAMRLQEGEVELVSRKPFLVMEKRSPLTQIAEGLTRFGFGLRIVDDAVPYLNSFFVFQLLYLPAALCNTALGHFLSFKEGRDLARGIIAEGLRMLEKTARRTAKLPLMDPKELLERLERGSASFDRARILPDRSYSPILQDLLLRKPTEAREITKRAVEMAASVGLELPWNWKVYQKAGRVLSLGFFRSPAELTASLA
jgi:ketopantoate reductase